MASPHPHYSQPGPSSSLYRSHYAFGGNPPHHQNPPHPPPRFVNGVGVGGYPHQGPHRPGLAYNPHYAPPQQYQPGHYPPFEHQRPFYPQHHTNSGPAHMIRTQNSPNRATHFIPPLNAPRHSAGPFPPTLPPHAQQYAHTSPRHSPSVLPKQLLMSPPKPPLQHPSPQSPARAQSDRLLLVSSQESHPTSPSPPTSTAHKSPSPVLQTSSPAHAPHSPNHQKISTELSSPTALCPSVLQLQLEPPVPYRAFPERSNSNFSLRYRRPDVLAAAAVTVDAAARPPLSFYDLTAHLDEESLEAPVSPPTNTSSLLLEVGAKLPLTPDSPQHQSLTSSATTTTSTLSNTPTLGSPSSATSVSLPTQSPSRKTFPSPTASAGTIATDVPEATTKPAPTPFKKSWASLLRPQPTDTYSSTSRKVPNKLPTSSVQGFSVSAASASVRSPDPTAALVHLLTSPPVLVGPVSPLRARGLVNLGNMCFANTVLQVLVFCTPFYRLFVELDRIPRGETPHATPLVDATVAFMREFHVQTKAQEEEDRAQNAFVPSCIYEGLKEKKRFDSMRGGQQEDAEEFLGFYLDTLEEELLSMIVGGLPTVASSQSEEHVERDTQDHGWLEVTRRNRSVVMRTHKSMESPISRIFGGRFRTALRVPGARESVIVDPWSRLQLDIQPEYVHTIEDALRHGAAPGTVQVARLGSQGDASQQTLIDALPPVLVLHLKRFLYDTAVGDVVKLRKRIEFGTELEVPNEAMAPARRARPHKYQLFGVLNHHGNSAAGGHYTLDVLHPNTCEGWLRIDDEFVQHLREDELLARDMGDDRTAYLLFYQRTDPSGTRI